jgi:hypothetical protein
MRKAADSFFNCLPWDAVVLPDFPRRDVSGVNPVHDSFAADAEMCRRRAGLNKRRETAFLVLCRFGLTFAHTAHRKYIHKVPMSSLLQSISIRAGVSRRYVEKRIKARGGAGIGVRRRGKRGHWVARGPMSPDRLDRIVRALGFTPKPSRLAADQLAGPFGPYRALLDSVSQSLQMQKTLADPRLSLAVDFEMAKRGATSVEDALGVLTEDDFGRDAELSQVMAGTTGRMVRAGKDVAESSVAAYRIHNRGGKITRRAVAAELGISVSEHHERVTPTEFAAIKASPHRIAKEKPRGLADDLRRFLDSPAAQEDDSARELARFMGLSWSQFRSLYSMQEIDAAYAAANREQIGARFSDIRGETIAPDEHEGGDALAPVRGDALRGLGFERWTDAALDRWQNLTDAEKAEFPPDLLEKMEGEFARHYLGETARPPAKRRR